MSEPEPEADAPVAKKSKMPLILGLVLALAGGGGAFYATFSGMVLAGDSHTGEKPGKPVSEAPGVAFVSIDPLVVSLGESAGKQQHLRFRADLEVPESYAEEVAILLPRVVDVLNGYLRALDPGDLQERAILTRLRAQMLRRIQVVVGQGRVKDLLVMEFVLN